MKFGPVAVAQSGGAIVAHSVRRDGLVLKKGQRISADQALAMAQAGIEQVVVAQLEDGDTGEDEAALQLARQIAGAHVRVEPPFTGRSNLYSQVNGVLVLDESGIEHVNDADERITFATLKPWQSVVEGEMIGTVKIIPYAVDKTALARALEGCAQPLMHVAAYQPLRVSVVSTLLQGLKPSTINKTLRVLMDRLKPAGAQIAGERRVDHAAAPLQQAISDLVHDCDILIIFGASAIADRRDVIPTAIELAGGEIEHFGMPVDPGNLLLIGRIKVAGRRVHILGAPGCARSSRLNGFDWVLQRLLAGIDVRARDIKRMGVGGLLMEIVSRGQPRERGADDVGE